MTTITFTAPATIEAADTDARTLRGVVMPWAVAGRTSVGVLSVPRGALHVPADLRRVKLFREHGRTTPIGYAVAADDSETGLAMTFRVAATADGDQALIEASEGLRDAFSVEMDADDVSDGVVRNAQLRAVAQVAMPAYDDARIAASETDPDDAETDADDTDDEEEPDVPEEETIEAGHVPAEHARRQGAQLTISGVPAPRTFAEAAAQLAISAQHRGITSASSLDEVNAALADITPAPATNGLANAFLRPEWLGELWTPEFSQRDFIDAIGSKPLTAMKWDGWKWEERPEVDKWAGNKTEIPTGPVSIVPATGEAYRVAGGWDVDRIFTDLGSPGFIEALFSAATADYRMKSEGWVAEDLLDAGTVPPDPPPTTLVGGLDLVVRALTLVGARLSYLAMSTDLWTEFVSLSSDEVPWWLKNQASVNIGDTSTNIGGIRIFTNHTLPAGTMLGGDRRALDYRETGPIRAQAINLPLGGVDIAVFGYQGTLVQDARGVVRVGVGAEGGELAAAVRVEQQAARVKRLEELASAKEPGTRTAKAK